MAANSYYVFLQKICDRDYRSLEYLSDQDARLPMRLHGQIRTAHSDLLNELSPDPRTFIEVIKGTDARLLLDYIHHTPDHACQHLNSYFGVVRHVLTSATLTIDPVHDRKIKQSVRTAFPELRTIFEPRVSKAPSAPVWQPFAHHFR